MWRSEVFSYSRDPSPLAACDSIWKDVWDSTSNVSSDELSAYHRVNGGWLEQVRSSFLLRKRCGKPENSIYLPPRYISGTGTGIQVHPDDDIIEMRPDNIDIEGALGRATCSRTVTCTDVVIGFEKGVGVLCFCRDKPAPVFFHHVLSASSADQVSQGIHMMAPNVLPNGGELICSTTLKKLISIDINRRVHRMKHRVRRPLRFREIDHYESEDGHLVELTTSTDGGLILLGFDTGRVRVCSPKRGVLYILSMRESCDMLVANSRYIVSASFMQPIGCAVWDARDGRAMYRFDQTSVGWEEVTAIAGLASTPRVECFAVWNGKDSVRILDVLTGIFREIIQVRSADPAIRIRGRNAIEEGELGAPSAHVGRGRIAVSHDMKTLLVSSNNRAFVVDTIKKTHVQLEGARRNLVAMANDERTCVTADADAFGELGTWVTGRTALGRKHGVTIWDTTTGECRSRIELPAAAEELDVAANLVVVTAKKMGQVVIHQF